MPCHAFCVSTSKITEFIYFKQVNFVILIIVLRWMSQKRSFIANNAKKRDEIR